MIAVAADVRGIVRARAGTRPRGRSAGDDEVYGLGAVAFLVGPDREGDAFALSQRLEPGPFDRSDMHEHLATTVIRLDEAIAALGIEELNGTCHCHWDAPNPKCRRPSRPTARLDILLRGRASAVLWASVTPPAPIGGGTSKPTA